MEKKKKYERKSELQQYYHSRQWQSAPEINLISGERNFFSVSLVSLPFYSSLRFKFWMNTFLLCKFICYFSI